MVPFRFHFPISRGESLPLAPQGALAAVTEVQRRAVKLCFSLFGYEGLLFEIFPIFICWCTTVKQNIGKTRVVQGVVLQFVLLCNE